MATRVSGAGAVFVGRDKELARLHQALEDVAVAVLYGTAGVGKSALAAALAARWSGPIARYTAADEPSAVLLDDVRRQLAGGPVAEAASDGERIRDVAARLDELAGMLIVDDLHRLPAAVRAALLGELGNQLTRGRLVATSRERMPLRARDAERFELRLGELDVAGARALWSALDRLHGAVPGFDEARLRTRGNPLFLRRAHAGDLDDDDPIAAAVRDLPADERTLAGALALATNALPAATLVQLAPDGANVLRRLVTCMIVDLDGAGAALLHDLFRQAIVSSLSRAERAGLHAALANVLMAAQLEPVSTAREVCRHLVAGENWPELGAYLLRQAPELIRRGAVGELVRGLDQIPRAHRTALVELARARALARLLELHTAHDELRRLLGSARADSRFEIQLAFTQVALLAADLATAERVAREVLAVPELPGPVLMRAQFVFAAIRAHRGAGAEAREFLARALAGTDQRFHQGYLMLCVALTYWLDGLDAECEEPMRRAQSLLGDIPATFRTAILAPSFFTAVLARLGRFEEAAAVVATTESLASEGQDLRMRAEISSMRAMLLFERGDHGAALRLLEPIADAYERGGYKLGALWARAWIGRILLQLGRRRRARSLLDRTEAQANELGVASVVRVIANARAEDPLGLLERGESSGPSIAALLAAARGDTVQARALLASVGPHPLARVLTRLCEATLARVDGDHADARAHVDRAVVAAAEADIDAELVPSLLAVIGTLRVVTPSGCRIAPAHALQLAANATVLDGRTHELRARGKVVSFRRRVAARRLLYAVASRPGTTVANEELARRCWRAEYNPLMHDNVIRVGMRRLRLLVAGTGIDVEHDGEGYRLSAPATWCYIEPES